MAATDRGIAPAIILVRPQLGMNIGMTARAMANFGLADLRLVNPRDGWPNPDAGPAASGADHVLAGLQVFASVDAALHDCRLTYATSMLPKGMVRPVATPRHAAATIHNSSVKAGILFGPEAAGMSRDDLAAIQTFVIIPTAPDFGSLNLAQAVLTLAYEWWQAGDTGPAIADAREPPAPHAEFAGLIDQLTDALAVAGYFNVADRAPHTRRSIAGMLARGGYTAPEVRTWRGMIRALMEERERRIDPAAKPRG
jgi:tRNA/rRNA methyltransferase